MVEDVSDLDLIAGTYGMLAIMAALYHRDRYGEGQLIELAQGEAGFIAATEAAIEYVCNRREMGPQGNQHRVLAPHGTYPCAGEDRWIAIACRSDEEWNGLARAAGHEGWLGPDHYRTAAGRREARAELDAAIGSWTALEDETTLTQRLQKAGVSAFPVMRIFDILADPHCAHRRRHFRLDDAFPADELYDGNPRHLSEAALRLRLPAPEPGEHNAEVFGELLGLSSEEMRDLQADGVIAWPAVHQRRRHRQGSSPLQSGHTRYRGRQLPPDGSTGRSGR